MKTYAIVENEFVVNVIVADDEFAKEYNELNNNSKCIEYNQEDEDRDLVAFIGNMYIDNKFLTPKEAYQYGYIDFETAVSLDSTIEKKSTVEVQEIL